MGNHFLAVAEKYDLKITSPAGSNILTNLGGLNHYAWPIATVWSTSIMFKFLSYFYKMRVVICKSSTLKKISFIQNYFSSHGLKSTSILVFIYDKETSVTPWQRLLVPPLNEDCSIKNDNLIDIKWKDKFSSFFSFFFFLII